MAQEIKAAKPADLQVRNEDGSSGMEHPTANRGEETNCIRHNKARNNNIDFWPLVGVL